MNRKYCSIDIAKFFFSLMIAVYHFCDYYNVSKGGGFIAVEFFFIVSGFLLMNKHMMLVEQISPTEFVWNRAKKYYPHYIFMYFILFFGFNFISYGIDLRKLITDFFSGIPQVFMLHGTILSDEYTHIHNGPTWYLSPLLLVGYVMWTLLNKNRKFVLQAAPIVSFWIYAYMSYTLGTTSNWRTHVFEIFNYAILRGTAGMSLGVVVFQLKEHLTRKTVRGGGVYLCLGSVILTTVFLASYIWYGQASFIYVVGIAVSLTLMTAGEDLCAPGRDSRLPKIAGRLSKLSYAIYLDHILVTRVMKLSVFPVYHHWVIPVYLIFLLTVSVCTTAFLDSAGHCIKKLMGIRRAKSLKA